MASLSVLNGYITIFLMDMTNYITILLIDVTIITIFIMDETSLNGTR